MQLEKLLKSLRKFLDPLIEPMEEGMFDNDIRECEILQLRLHNTTDPDALLDLQQEFRRLNTPGAKSFVQITRDAFLVRAMEAGSHLHKLQFYVGQSNNPEAVLHSATLLHSRIRRSEISFDDEACKRLNAICNQLIEMLADPANLRRHLMHDVTYGDPEGVRQSFAYVDEHELAPQASQGFGGLAQYFDEIAQIFIQTKGDRRAFYSASLPHYEQGLEQTRLLKFG